MTRAVHLLLFHTADVAHTGFGIVEEYGADFNWRLVDAVGVGRTCNLGLEYGPVGFCIFLLMLTL